MVFYITKICFHTGIGTGKTGVAMRVTEKVLIQNLEDAGYCRMDCQMFLRLPKQEQLEMLEKKRKDLLIELHKTKDRLDCLDYLRHQYQK